MSFRYSARERRRLLARHATVMNRHGSDSYMLYKFMRRHGRDKELASLMSVAKMLKLALTRGGRL